MNPRPTPRAALAAFATLVAMSLPLASGCGSQPPEADTAEVSNSRSTPEPAKAETPSEPAAKAELESPADAPTRAKKEASKE